MFYTVQELLAQIKGWEYIIAILFLAMFVLYWRALSREPKRHRQRQASGVASRTAQGSGLPATDGKPRLNLGLQGLPCWEVKGCFSKLKERCPAYALKPVPCWLTRSLVAGKAWRLCDACPLYACTMRRLMEVAKERSAAVPGASAEGPRVE